MSEATCGTAADPHVASLMRATITEHNSAFSRQHSPEFCKFVRSSQREGVARPSREGAGKTGCALHPRSRVQKQQTKTHTSIQVQRKQSGLPCAMVLRLIFVLSPVRPELVCHRRRADTSAQLNTSHRGVRTTRLCRPLQPHSSVAAFASTAPRPNVSDDGQRPLSRDGMGEIRK